MKVTNKNRFWSIIKVDRYGTQYVKNFMLDPYGHVTVQHWTNIDSRIKTKYLGDVAH